MMFKLFDIDFFAYLLYLTAISLRLTLCTSLNNVECFSSELYHYQYFYNVRRYG